MNYIPGQLLNRTDNMPWVAFVIAALQEKNSYYCIFVGEHQDIKYIPIQWLHAPATYIPLYNVVEKMTFYPGDLCSRKDFARWVSFVISIDNEHKRIYVIFVNDEYPNIHERTSIEWIYDKAFNGLYEKVNK